MHPFSPQRETPAALSKRTVGRGEILDNLQDKLLTAATTASKPHVLLAGPRGCGKTHLVGVALYRAGRKREFDAVVVRIPEDSVMITRFSDLLSAVLRVLGETPGEDRQAQIAAALDGRTVVLVVENLDRVFRDIGLEGQRNLRAWIETSGQVMLLATTPTLFAGVTDREQPWFGGLATIMVPDLDEAEVGKLVGRDVGHLVEQVGGSPRVWLLLAEANLDVEAALESLVPYYQQLLWTLSPNERRLVVALAGGPLTVAQVAHAAEIDPRTAATALRRLADAGWVWSRKPEAGDRRQTYYDLRDGLLGRYLRYRLGTEHSQ